MPSQCQYPGAQTRSAVCAGAAASGASRAPTKSDAALGRPPDGGGPAAASACVGRCSTAPTQPAIGTSKKTRVIKLGQDRGSQKRGWQLRGSIVTLAGMSSDLERQLADLPEEIQRSLSNRR